MPDGRRRAGQGVPVEQVAELIDDSSDDSEGETDDDIFESIPDSEQLPDEPPDEGEGGAFDPDQDPAQFIGEDEGEGSSESDGRDFGAGAEAPLGEGHFMIREHPIPLDLIVPGLLVDRGEFILQGSDRGAEDETVGRDEEDAEEVDIDAGRTAIPTSTDLDAWEAEYQAQGEHPTLPIGEYRAYRRVPADEKELEVPDRRHGYPSAVLDDEPNYEEGSEGSDLSTLLKELGIEGEDAEEASVQKELEAGQAHMQMAHEETERQQEYGEDKDGIAASQRQGDAEADVQAGNDDHTLDPDVD